MFAKESLARGSEVEEGRDGDADMDDMVEGTDINRTAVILLDFCSVLLLTEGKLMERGACENLPALTAG
jgi:hypothetical protein